MGYVLSYMLYNEPIQAQRNNIQLLNSTANNIKTANNSLTKASRYKSIYTKQINTLNADLKKRYNGYLALNEIALLLPQSSLLNKINLSSKTLSLGGTTETTKTLATYLQHLKQSRYVFRPKLTQLDINSGAFHINLSIP